jgi:hypothetical protein
MEHLFEFATGSKRAFRDAAENGDLEAAKSLMDQGQDVESASDYGATALHKAAAAGKLDMVRLLLERGADITAVHNGECSPLQEATRNGHHEVVAMLEKWSHEQSGSAKKQSQRVSNASMFIDGLSSLVENTAATAVLGGANIFDVATEESGQYGQLLRALDKFESTKAVLSANKNPLVANLALLQIYTNKHSTAAETSSNLNTADPSFVALTHRYVRIARGVYDGFDGVRDCIILRDVLADRLEASAASVAAAVAAAVVPAPAHIIYLDHLTHSMVIAIRGTASLSDCITDAVCTSTPFVGGFAHAGVAAAARAMALDQELMKLVKGSMPDGYKLVITGNAIGRVYCSC